MARAAVRLVFAAMLALLSTQAAVPSFSSARVGAAVETVWRMRGVQAEAEQRAPQAIRRVGVVVRVRQSAPAYRSLVAPEPDTVLFFQLPPPASSSVS